MPTFVNRAERYLLTTSYKVMYSTLTRQPALTKLSPRSLYVLRLWLDARVRHYMLARDPYARLVSFYFNKLADPQRRVEPGHRWELCQRVFFPHVGLSGREDPVVVDARLRTVSFASFVELLDRVAMLDDHLVPQVESRYRRLRGTRVGLRLPVHRVVRIETDLEWVRTVLRLDVAIHENKSTAERDAELFTPALCAVVNRIYERDFVELGYPTR